MRKNWFVEIMASVSMKLANIAMSLSRRPSKIVIYKDRGLDFSLGAPENFKWPDGTETTLNKVHYQAKNGKPAYLLVEGIGNLDVFSEYDTIHGTTADFKQNIRQAMMAGEAYKSLTVLDKFKKWAPWVGGIGLVILGLIIYLAMSQLVEVTDAMLQASNALKAASESGVTIEPGTGS